MRYNLRDKKSRKRPYSEINPENSPNKRQKTNMIISYTNPENISWDEFNKSPNLDPNNSKNWISATSLKNYLLRDPILDWFEYYNIDQDLIPKIRTNNPKHTEKPIQILFDMGLKFEASVINYLRSKYPDNIKKVLNNISELKPDLNNLTKKYMAEGVPIIEQAVLYNFQNLTFGIADLLIRSDYINKLFDQPIISHEEESIGSPNLNLNFHYRVIDIKWTKIKLCTNGRTIRNEARFPSYKGQLAVYNSAMGLIQGYIPPEAYILAKSWKITNKNKLEGFNCFTLLATIDYTDFDQKYISESIKAISWVRNMRTNGHGWTCVPPSAPELYPNMHNNLDSPYHNIKKLIADKIRELTQIWMVGIKNRNIGHNRGIFSWDNPTCNSKNLGISGKKIGPIIDQIIQINRGDLNKNIYPDKIKNNISDWNTKNNSDFYIDFETCSGCFSHEINIHDSSADGVILYLIGIGHEINNNFVYKYFLADKLDLFQESKIIRDFIEYISNFSSKPRLFHWSHAEKSILNLLNTRHKNSWGDWIANSTWIDLCKIFIDEPIILKGAKNFNLKEIGKNLNQLGLIQTNWINTGPSGGLDAMMLALDYYKQNNPEKINSIINYNQIDCKIIWDITNYLRNNHI